MVGTIGRSRQADGTVPPRGTPLSETIIWLTLLLGHPFTPSWYYLVEFFGLHLLFAEGHAVRDGA